MMLEALIAEFEHEAESTRKLLHAVPASHVKFKPSPTSWSMGELAQHIATIYYWYVGTLTQDEYDMSADSLERGSPEDIHATRELFEANVEKAREALLSLKEEDLQTPWVMKSGDRTIMGPFPRGTVARGFLFNHIYHHRGEMIVYLRSTGNKVPGLYGPTYEDS
ncbi:DinB family protein [Fluviicola sp.]|uniref:DinB family protein n=1 Tax=Fluviicola sp. TaxID=1917219 RepID=UPI0031DAF839